MKEFRLYTFGNFYMSSIQQGIQGLHSTTELFIKYEDSSKDFTQRSDLFDWAHTDKTVICLNGGMNSDLENIKELFENTDNPYAWSYFNEAPEAMNGMLTNVAVILPDKIYETARLLRTNKHYRIYNNKVLLNTLYNEYNNVIGCDEIMDVTDFDIKIMELLNSCSLAK